MATTFTQDEVLRDIQRVTAQSSVRLTAARLKINAAQLGHILCGRRPVSAVIAAAFGYEREIIFRKTQADRVTSNRG